MKSNAQSLLSLLVTGVTAALLFLVWCDKKRAGADPTPPDGGWGRICEGFQLEADLETLGVRRVVRVVVNCVLRNVSSEVVHVAESYPEHHYRLAVTDARGRPIAPIGDASEVAGRTVREVQPEQELHDQYSLNRMYLIADPGEYSITASRLVFRSEGESFAEVESGPVVLVVCDDPEAENAQASGDWGPVAEGFQLRIQVSPAVIPPRPPLLLSLTMQNVANRLLRIAEGSQLHDYRLTVTDGDGREIPIVRGCMHVREAAPTVREVGPGEAFTYEYDLNMKYDFVEPGEYTITARRRVPRLDGEGSTWVESNAVLLTVSEEL